MHVCVIEQKKTIAINDINMIVHYLIIVTKFVNYSQLEYYCFMTHNTIQVISNISNPLTEWLKKCDMFP